MIRQAYIEVMRALSGDSPSDPGAEAIAA